MSVYERGKLKETSKEEGLPLLSERVPRGSFGLSTKELFKRRISPFKSEKRLQINRNSENSFCVYDNQRVFEDGRLARIEGKRSSMPHTQSLSTQVKRSLPTNPREFSSDDWDNHRSASSILSQSLQRIKRRTETTPEKKSLFYDSFEPIYSMKMEKLDAHHRHSISGERKNEYKQLKTLAREKLVTLLKENLEMGHEEIEKIMRSSNPFATAFEFQLKNKQEFYQVDEPSIPHYTDSGEE